MKFILSDVPLLDELSEISLEDSFEDSSVSRRVPLIPLYNIHYKWLHYKWFAKRLTEAESFSNDWTLAIFDKASIK